MDRTSAHVTVPPVLVELAKRVVRAFYGTAAGYGDELNTVIVDILIRTTCTKEDDLVRLIQIDSKTVVSRLNILCKEHLIKRINDVDPDAPPPEEGEQEKTAFFYYIDYEMLVNVVRLRLHMMQEEFRESTQQELFNRPKAKCTQCGRGYLDTDMDQLFDPFTGMLVCEDPYCKGEVAYDETKVDVGEVTSSARSARFNEQLNPFLELLRKAEKETIVAAIAAPTPTRKSMPSRGRGGGLKEPLKGFAVNTQTTIDFTDGEREATVKQKPLMHTGMALGSEFVSGPGASVVADGRAGTDGGQGAASSAQPSVADDEILELLQESTGAATATAPEPNALKRPADTEPDEDEDEVEVQGVAIPLSRVTEADVARMTEDERQFYLELKELV
eukprot:m.71379 g.71379  ORF g.71379 m.71379 type:complete len:388 (+) comp8704_c0_seq3:274-1437(+)